MKKYWQQTPHINVLRQKKLKGKLSKSFACGCCSITNTKRLALDKSIMKDEMRSYLNSTETI